jgi:hypothetical protein
MLSAPSAFPDQPGARLIGIEYIVSERLFQTFPAEETRHSHAFEVASGTVVAPGVPAPAARAEMQKLAGTYGNTWQVDRGDALPLGEPPAAATAPRCHARAQAARREPPPAPEPLLSWAHRDS